MNPFLSEDLRALGDCGCGSADAPAQGARPGLPAVPYRVGTHPDLKAAMLARLSHRDLAALHALRTRADDDPAIALLDAWATVGDVLTFYQERIANESWIGTATERRSLLELARLIGYELRPGVAAEAHLAFTVERVPGSPVRVRVPVGSKVQSVPAQDQQAQTFETVEALEARSAWNALRPRRTRRHSLSATTTRLLLPGLSTGVLVGNGVLFPLDVGGMAFARVTGVTVVPDRQQTELAIEVLSASPVTGTFPSIPVPIAKMDAAVQPLVNATRTQAELAAQAVAGGWSVQALFDNLAANPPAPPEVIVLRERAGILGSLAQPYATLPHPLRVDELAYETGSGTPAPVVPKVVSGVFKDRKSSWAEQTLDAYKAEAGGSGTDLIFLDSPRPGLSPFVSLDPGAGHVVLVDGENWGAYRIAAVAEVAASAYGVTARTTRLKLATSAGFGSLSIRGTAVFARSELLRLAEESIPEPVSAGSEDWIPLDGWVDGLTVGRAIAWTGERADAYGLSATQVLTLQGVEHDLARGAGTRIRVSPALDGPYARASVTINANVALATHGETVHEILGGGDATRAFQRFTLRQPPLTHVGADTATGSASTLEIRVEGVRWHEVPFLLGRGPRERIYVTRREDDGRTVVQFGDGLTGARLPSGQDNVRATYRKGIGLAGVLRAGQLTTMMSRPLGLKDALNPLPTAGAADPETREAARANAPLTVTTLERVVSLRDYEDFARAFAGVAKARATWVWQGERRAILLTVAGPAGAIIAEGHPVHAKLRKALRAAGDRHVPLLLQACQPVSFRVDATVRALPDHQPVVVAAAVESMLRARFSFAERAFGQGVALSEVVAAIHAVAGVAWVTVQGLERDGVIPLEQPAAWLPAALPIGGSDGKIAPAELLLLDPAPLGLAVLP